MALVTPAEVASHLNITPSPTGAELTKLTEHTTAALEYVESQCGPLGDAEGDELTFSVRPSGDSLVLPAARLAAVTEVRDPDDALVDVAPAQVDLLAGVVERVPVSGPGTWQVTVTLEGRGASLKLAVKIIAGHLWETQRGRTDPHRAAMHANGGDRDRVPVSPTGFAIPARAAQLISPFVLPGFA